jgi:hypothetical protein
LAAGLLYDAKTTLARFPTVALPLQRMRGHGEVVDRKTDIVIESFPRCASSFAVAAFRLAQEPRPMRIANHTHMPAQVIVGARRGLPTLVLTRPPVEAVVSLLIRDPDLPVPAALRGYVRFYEPLVRYRSRLVVGTFDEVISDFGSVIRRINERFGTSFGLFEHNSANLNRIAAEIERDYGLREASEDRLERIIPRPSPLRQASRDAVRKRFHDQAPKGLMARALAVHRVFDS